MNSSPNSSSNSVGTCAPKSNIEFKHCFAYSNCPPINKQSNASYPHMTGLRGSCRFAWQKASSASFSNCCLRYDIPSPYQVRHELGRISHVCRNICCASCQDFLFKYTNPSRSKGEKRFLFCS